MIVPAVRAIFEPRSTAVTNALFQGERLGHLKHMEARSINVPKPKGSGHRSVVMPRPAKKRMQWWVAKMPMHSKSGGDRVVFGQVKLRFIECMTTRAEVRKMALDESLCANVSWREVGRIDLRA